DGDLFAEGAGGEEEAAASGEIVAVGGRAAVGGRVANPGVESAWGGERDRELERLAAGAALAGRGVRDRERGLRGVVEDRAPALIVGDRRVDGVAEVDEEALVALVERVAVDADRHLLALHPRRKGQRAARRGVVRARARRPVRGRIVNAHRLTARGRNAD